MIEKARTGDFVWQYYLSNIRKIGTRPNIINCLRNLKKMGMIERRQVKDKHARRKRIYYGLTFNGVLYAILMEFLSPSEVGKEENLDSVLEMLSRYRVWKQDKRQFTDEEKERYRSLYNRIACFLPYFADYYSWKIKTYRNIGLEEPLSAFFSFCIDLILVCWSVRDFFDDEAILLEYFEQKMTIQTDEKNPWLEVVEHLNKDPYRCVYDAYTKKNVKPSDIVTLGSFSKHGYRDIYFRESFLQELYLLELSLRNPLEAYFFQDNIETLRKMILEDKIQPVSVKALFEAITNKAKEESTRIVTLKLRKQKQMHEKYQDRPLEEYEAKVRKEQKQQKRCDKRDAEEALKQIIEVSDLDVTEDKLKEVLINYKICERLRNYIDRNCGKIDLKLKDKII
jgi:DNA-binding PadR family transcriptional regulator